MPAHCHACLLSSKVKAGTIALTDPRLQDQSRRGLSSKMKCWAKADSLSTSRGVDRAKIVVTELVFALFMPERKPALSLHVCKAHKNKGQVGQEATAVSGSVIVGKGDIVEQPQSAAGQAAASPESDAEVKPSKPNFNDPENNPNPTDQSELPTYTVTPGAGDVKV